MRRSEAPVRGRALPNPRCADCRRCWPRGARARPRQLSGRGVPRRRAVLRPSPQSFLAARLGGYRCGARRAALPPPTRRAALESGIGLGDVIVACRRRGSLDGAIRDAEPPKARGCAAPRRRWPSYVSTGRPRRARFPRGATRAMRRSRCRRRRRRIRCPSRRSSWHGRRSVPSCGPLGSGARHDAGTVAIASVALIVMAISGCATRSGKKFFFFFKKKKKKKKKPGPTE